MSLPEPSRNPLDSAAEPQKMARGTKRFRGTQVGNLCSILSPLLADWFSIVSLVLENKVRRPRVVKSPRAHGYTDLKSCERFSGGNSGSGVKPQDELVMGAHAVYQSRLERLNIFVRFKSGWRACALD